MNSTKARKVLMSVAALAVTGAIAGAGTWASFSSTRTATQDVDAGTVFVTLNGNAETQTVAFDTAANIAPGDTWNRFVRVENTSTLALSEYTLTGSDDVAVADSLVRGTDGLKVTIKTCAADWDNKLTAPTCSADEAVVVSKGTAAVAETSLLGNNDAYLWFAFEMPGTAGNEYQDDDADLTYTFNAVQRAGAPQG